MNKNIYILVWLLLGVASFAQEVDVVEQGGNYTQAVYYDLATGEKTVVDYTQWDIAFSFANRSVGVLINEALSSEENASPASLYVTSAEDFESADTVDITDTLYNSSTSWGQGAFNEAADTSDVFDFGWGAYNPATHIVNGTRIFLVRLRSGDFKKIKINAYRDSKYIFTYADLDGENEVIDSVAASDYEGKTLAYYSLENGEALDLEPDSWDLKFDRYFTPLVAGPGVILDYNVTGVLSNAGVEVAEAGGVDPATVDYHTYLDSLSSDLEVIGHEWKTYDFNVGAYTVPDDRVYFVKTATDSIWKVQFLDFDNTTGASTFEKTFLDVLASNALVPSFVESSILFPNPVSSGERMTLELSSRASFDQATLTIYNAIGQVMENRAVRINQGPNRIQTTTIGAAGMHYLVLKAGPSILTKSFFIQR